MKTKQNDKDLKISLSTFRLIIVASIAVAVLSFIYGGDLIYYIFTETVK